jgi:hypothetical protein
LGSPAHKRNGDGNAAAADDDDDVDNPKSVRKSMCRGNSKDVVAPVHRTSARNSFKILMALLASVG